MIRRSIGFWIAIVLTCGSFAQQPPDVLRGSWSATVGPNQVYRGQWSGQPLPGQANAVQGSWLVLNDASQILLQGTWAADKAKEGWRGQWSARIATGRQASGPMLSGTWQSTADAKSATLAEMLQRTLVEQVSGSWSSGRLAGNWWLKGLRK